MKYDEVLNIESLLQDEEEYSPTDSSILESDEMAMYEEWEKMQNNNGIEDVHNENAEAWIIEDNEDALEDYLIDVAEFSKHDNLDSI